MSQIILERNKTQEQAEQSVKVGTSIKVESILKNRNTQKEEPQIVILPIFRGG